MGGGVLEEMGRGEGGGGRGGDGRGLEEIVRFRRRFISLAGMDQDGVRLCEGRVDGCRRHLE